MNHLSILKRPSTKMLLMQSTCHGILIMLNNTDDRFGASLQLGSRIELREFLGCQSTLYSMPLRMCIVLCFDRLYSVAAFIIKDYYIFPVDILPLAIHKPYNT